MTYSDYNELDPSKSGNILTVNPDGIDYRALTVRPGTFQFVCSKCGKPLDRWYNGAWVKVCSSR